MMRAMARVLFLLLMAGCSVPLRVKDARSLADTNWTHAYGAPAMVRVSGSTLFVAAEKGLYALENGKQRWAAELPPAHRALAASGDDVVVSGNGSVGAWRDGQK